MLVEGLLDGDVIGDVSGTDDEGGWTNRPDVKVVIVPQVVRSTEILPVVVGMNVWGKGGGHFDGDQEVAEDGMVGWAWLGIY